MIKGLLIVKYVVIVGSFVCAGLSIVHLVKIQMLPVEPSELGTFDVAFNSSLPLPVIDDDPFLSDRYLRCLLQPSKPFCLLSADKRLELFRSDSAEDSPGVEVVESRLENVSSTFQRAESDVYLLISDLTDLMHSFGVRSFIVEPSILYCLLPYFKRHDLLLSGVSPGRVLGSRNIVTFGVFEEDSKVLNEVNATNVLLSAGFKIMKMHKWKRFDSDRLNETDDSFEPVHYFFVRDEVAAHVVVFYRRHSYLWHSGLNPDEIDLDGLLFVDEGMHERFHPRSILGPQRANAFVNQFYVPHNMKYFLAETISSTSLRCFGDKTAAQPAHSHPTLTVEELEVRVALALREVKRIVSPSLVPFWLCSKSLQGWFERCDVLYYASVLELCLGLKTDQEPFLAERFSDSDLFKVRNDSLLSDSTLQFDALGLDVDITILHGEQTIGRWQAVNKGQYEFRYYEFPTLQELCSADVFGQKVNVPCK